MTPERAATVAEAVDDCVVIDPGPIGYSSLEVTGDGELEATLTGDDLEPVQTTFRLIEIPLSAVDVFPWLDRWLSEGYAAETVEAVRSGVSLPPLVGRVGGDTFVVLDGVHRLAAWKAVGRERVLAYELLPG